MNQFEKVCNGLECCVLRDPDDHQRCGECPYNHHEISNAPCANGLKADALALIRQQRERIAELEAAIAEWEKFIPFLYQHGMLSESPKEEEHESLERNRPQL